MAGTRAFDSGCPSSACSNAADVAYTTRTVSLDPPARTVSRVAARTTDTVPLSRRPSSRARVVVRVDDDVRDDDLDDDDDAHPRIARVAANVPIVLPSRARLPSPSSSPPIPAQPPIDQFTSLHDSTDHSRAMGPCMSLCESTPDVPKNIIADPEVRRLRRRAPFRRTHANATIDESSNEPTDRPTD
jgi:hypothetical protein